jgi:hypothetical protein
MAITIYPTGPYETNAQTGISARQPYGTFNFCSPLITTPSAYQSNTVSGTGVCDFGGLLSQVYIVNTGTGALAFQWKEQWTTTPVVDGGFVPGGQTVRIDRANKSGLSVRSADSGTPTTCVVWGL